MATVREFLLKHHQKDEGTYKVKIQVTYNRRTAYINTDHRQGTGGLFYQKGGEADRLFYRYLPFSAGSAQKIVAPHCAFCITIKAGQRKLYKMRNETGTIGS